jgi:hypothetical protein
MTKRVYLHVGSPKTGTSLLQDVLFRNRELLARHGVHYPIERFDGHFLAALDLMQHPWAGLEKEAVGVWDALVAAVRRIPDGTVIISHEILARASREDIARVHAQLGADAELHVVLSARDLARQIPAEWQENVKHRRSFAYRRFLAIIRDPARSHPVGEWFWAVQDVPDILERWGAGLPPERVHLVTVPPRGAERGLLWQRFVTAFGLEGIPLDLDTGARDNPSLGVPETAFLRRLNLRLNGTVAGADYRPLVRELLAHQTLARRGGTPRLSLSPDVLPWVEEFSRAWVASLAGRGYDVVGSLDDLLPGDLPPFVDPDHARGAGVVTAALDAAEALVHEAIRLQHENERLGYELDRALALPASDRVKRRVYQRLVRSAAGRQVLRRYRRVRRRPDPDALG